MNVRSTKQLRRNLILAFHLIEQATYCQKCKERAYMLMRSGNDDNVKYALWHLESVDHQTIEDLRAKERKPVERAEVLEEGR